VIAACERGWNFLVLVEKSVNAVDGGKRQDDSQK
jgi:hypothetical protein